MKVQYTISLFFTQVYPKHYQEDFGKTQGLKYKQKNILKFCTNLNKNGDIALAEDKIWWTLFIQKMGKCLATVTKSIKHTFNKAEYVDKMQYYKIKKLKKNLKKLNQLWQNTM